MANQILSCSNASILDNTLNKPLENNTILETDNSETTNIDGIIETNDINNNVVDNMPIENVTYIDYNVEDSQDNISDIQNEQEQPIDQDNQDNQELQQENVLNNYIDNTTDCLALTVRRNYQIIAVKNFIKKSVRLSWKITLSVFTINFLNMFL